LLRTYSLTAMSRANVEVLKASRPTLFLSPVKATGHHFFHGNLLLIRTVRPPLYKLSILQRRHVSSELISRPHINNNISLFVLSLPIVFPTIPESGTKSRVETQIKLKMDLVRCLSDVGSPSGCYERIGSWKYLQLPLGLSTRRRPRKEPKLGKSIVQSGVEAQKAT
jgi:hypothetical protein